MNGMRLEDDLITYRLFKAEIARNNPDPIVIFAVILPFDRDMLLPRDEFRRNQVQIGREQNDPR